MSDEPEAGRQPILPELRSSLAAAKLKPLDSATAAVALRYAELLDECAVEKQYVKPLEMIGQAIASVADDMMNPTQADQLVGAFKKIESALAEHTTASDLGPKLLATLTSLNLTPAAREKGSKVAADGQGGEVIPMVNPLVVARDEAKKRNGTA